MRKGIKMEIIEGESVKNLGGEKKKKMKTKNKMIALVEIAIVLCSVFLVALPAIAAEQNQEMQKASTSEVTTASEDDYVLGIYGNANEDDTIDMRDLTYVKLIFFGKKPVTELADAKYDDKINPLDFIQIKLIIVGKEKELTLVDSADRIVTVKKPIKRIVSHLSYVLQAMRSLKVEKDKIVGVDESVADNKIYFPEFSELPSVGGAWELDHEAILSLNPDIVFASYKAAEHAEKLPGIPVVEVDFNKLGTYVEEIRKLGYILDKKDEAEELIDFYNTALNAVKEKAKGISEEDRPKVYFERSKPYQSGGRGSVYHETVTIAGGNNIFSDLKDWFDADPEEVVTRNPEIILKYPWWGWATHHIGTDITKLIDGRNEIMNRPELAEITAVKNGNVFIIGGDLLYGRHFVGIAYVAKWFHPELFEDLDPKAIHQEYLTRFQGLDYDLDEHGVFVYPEPS